MPGRDPFTPVTLNVVKDGHKVGEVHMVECVACYCLVYPPHSNRHFRDCPRRPREHDDY